MSMAMLGRQQRGFTLVEIMISMAILAGVLAAIYSSWMAILSASKSAQAAAVDVQRSRLAVRTLEESLVCAQMSLDLPVPFAFVADNDGDFSQLSFVSRLPASFPRSGRFGGQPLRRVEFLVERDPEGGQNLVLRQTPFLYEMGEGEAQEPLKLARNVVMFLAEFKGVGSEEWEEEWTLTNQLPRQVRFTIASAPKGRGTVNRQDVMQRVVVLPAGSSLAPIPGVTPGAEAAGQPSVIHNPQAIGGELVLPSAENR
ncbi:MAG: hypothetical protein RI897_2629 [Verrucomicrobiota bacterium]|jgi:prepilin-type N-terminal cleavage/methylation domain-containing protein